MDLVVVCRIQKLRALELPEIQSPSMVYELSECLVNQFTLGLDPAQRLGFAYELGIEFDVCTHDTPQTVCQYVYTDLETSSQGDPKLDERDCTASAIRSAHRFGGPRPDGNGNLAAAGPAGVADMIRATADHCTSPDRARR